MSLMSDTVVGKRYKWRVGGSTELWADAGCRAWGLTGAHVGQLGRRGPRLATCISQPCVGNHGPQHWQWLGFQSWEGQARWEREAKRRKKKGGWARKPGVC